MALAILPKPDILPEIIQLPLPDPAQIPAWVHAALDRWDTSHATYIGLQVTTRQYAELNEVSPRTRRVERKAFRRLRWLATMWQFANFRTFLTSFEMRLLELELEALQKPYAMKLYVHKYTVQDKDGSYHQVCEDTYQHDVDWIANYIQQRMKNEYHYIVGAQYVKHSLKAVSSILEVCAEMDMPVGYIENMRQHYQAQLEIVPRKRRRLQTALQKAS